MIEARYRGEAGPMLVATGLVRDYPSGDDVVHALRGVDLRVDRGQLVAVRGRSGSGKTTLLNLLGGLDRPTSGTVMVDGDEVSAMSESDLVGFRRSTVAFMFQAFGLLPILSAAENVEVPLRLVRAEPRARDARVAELLDLVGLADRADAVAGSLPFGDQKLLALARVLATEADVLLLDEPASGIDVDGVERMLDLIAKLRDRGKCVCIVEHNLHVVERVTDSIYFMEAGRVTAEGSMQQLIAQERLAEVYFGGA